jgi:hypothetical protein
MRFSQSSARYYQLEDDLLSWHVFKGFVSSLVYPKKRSPIGFLEGITPK